MTFDAKRKGLKTVDGLVRQRPNLVANSQSMPGAGKSHWLLTMPLPLAVADFDGGLEDVVVKLAPESQKMVVYESFQLDPEAKQLGYVKEFKRFREWWYKVSKDKEVMSMAIDGATELNELTRLATIGVLKGAAPMTYDDANVAYRKIIRAADNNHKHAIFTHQMKKRYVRTGKKSGKGNDISDWDGSYERKGFGEGSYLIKVDIENVYNSSTGDFSTTILAKCRPNPDLIGFELQGEENTFSGLYSLLYPEVDISDWRVAKWQEE